MSSSSLCRERAAELLAPLVSRSYCSAHTLLLAHAQGSFAGCSHHPTARDQPIWMERCNWWHWKNNKTTTGKARWGRRGFKFFAAKLDHNPTVFTRHSKWRESQLLPYSTLVWNPVISQMNQDFANVLSTVTCTSNTHIYLPIFLKKKKKNLLEVQLISLPDTPKNWIFYLLLMFLAIKYQQYLYA